VEKEYQASLPQVSLDEALSEQAFVNIIQNAYDAMSAEGGGVLRVQVKTARRSFPDRHTVDGVEVRIADSGPGIAPDLREQIFNPFVTTKKSGVGLGLSIVSKIVDGHHGSIRIEDSSGSPGDGNKNRGACFVMFFPAGGQQSSAAQKTHLVIS
jgi:nitrogen-specific signal transduction histidine kinase